ncbi:NAD(P)-binding domain-containing protein [Nostoc sp.]|uniref:NAD(P)-binding domain-containing protein n=1 Tax=Nostoc sp. TaxID=1180 RepID=UPI002FF9045A
MPIQTIGILSPGDMGQAIAAVLNQHGLKTIAALNDRSERTRQLAAAANIQDVGSLRQLVIESDVVLSVLVPAAATQAAKQVAEAIANVGKSIIYVDCNAIAPWMKSLQSSLTKQARTINLEYFFDGVESKNL